MLHKKFIISQIHIPFLFYLAKNLDNELIILINSYSELIMAHIIKKRRKSVTKIIWIKTSTDNLENLDFLFLEKRKGYKIKFLPDPKIFRSENILESDYCLLTWNSCEFIEQYLINVVKIPTIIFELGYFRPNSLVIANTFTKHFPSYFLDTDNIKIDLHGIEKIYLSKAWKTKTEKIILILKFILLLEMSFNNLRPRSFLKELKKVFLHFPNKIVLKLLIKLSKLKTSDNKKILAFFDQDSSDSSLLLDEFNVDRIKNIKRLIKDGKENNFHIIYRPHPLALNIKMAWLFFREGTSIEAEGSSRDLINKSHIISTFNSTVGFESLDTNKPIIVLGNAFYKNNSGVFSSLKSLLKNTDLVDKKERKEFVHLIKETHHFVNYS